MLVDHTAPLVTVIVGGGGLVVGFGVGLRVV
jgi:hypothetical protein